MEINLLTAESKLKKLPLLPLRDIVVYPGMVIPLFIGRANSASALEAAMSGGRYIFLAAQRNSKTEEPQPDDIYSVGTLCQIIQLLRLPNGNVKVLVEGKSRGEINEFVDNGEFYTVEVVVNPDFESEATSEIATLMVEACNQFNSYHAETKSNLPQETVANLAKITSPDLLVDSIAAHLNPKLEDKQAILSLFNVKERLEVLISIIICETEIHQLDHKIKDRVKKKMEKNHKEYYLNEQLKIIQNELGKKDDHADEYNEFEKRIAEKKLPLDAKTKAQSELKKLKMMSTLSAEAAVVRNYIETILDLPWSTYGRTTKDIHFAAKIMEEDHFGLEKVKTRILEHLAVQSLVRRIKGPIICLVGPPGVGKTSLARSIARATSRKFVKMSLGGVRDEAEIRGHRRTYIGAMPGKVLMNIKKAGVSNPLFLLDEIDKITSDFRGDPASALLEVLDPEQNSKFCDHFLDVEYDLSKVMFIATANSTHSIPRPLLDRMEIIRLEGYTDNEKKQIATKYLIPKQLKESGITERILSIPDESVSLLINSFTREPGVRGLERQIASICRKVAHAKVKGERWSHTANPEDVIRLLGPEIYRRDSVRPKVLPGVVNGLAWTESGGDILQVEVSVVPGKGKLTITGKLGEVMNESAQAAMTYVRSRYSYLHLDKDFYQSVDIHIHVPEGAIPKDGPSAGITMATAIVSALISSDVNAELAMTGEISLQGSVLPIGGLKEKLMASVRSGVKVVLVPEKNMKDVAEISQEIVEKLEIIPVGHMDDVLARALSLFVEPLTQGISSENSESSTIIVTH